MNAINIFIFLSLIIFNSITIYAKSKDFKRCTIYKIIDGDTIKIKLDSSTSNNKKLYTVRLALIDSPETRINLKLYKDLINNIEYPIKSKKDIDNKIQEIKRAGYRAKLNISKFVGKTCWVHFYNKNKFGRYISIIKLPSENNITIGEYQIKTNNAKIVQKYRYIDLDYFNKLISFLNK